MPLAPQAALPAQAGRISHRIYAKSSERMKELDDESVHLVATSPPY